MERYDGRLARAERRIREDEERVARLRPVAERLERTGHARAAAEARKVLADTGAALALRRDRLGLPRAPAAAHRGHAPAGAKAATAATSRPVSKGFSTTGAAPCPPGSRPSP